MVVIVETIDEPCLDTISTRNKVPYRALLTSMPITGINVTISAILQKENKRPPSMLGNDLEFERGECVDAVDVA